MNPLLIHTPATVVSLPHYTLPNEARHYSRSSEPNVDSNLPTIKYGDQRVNPTGFTVEARVFSEFGVEVAASSAYNIISASESAHLVETYQGAREVDGLLSYQVRPDISGVRLTLEFAPKHPNALGVIGHVVRLDDPIPGDAIIRDHLIGLGYDVIVFDGRYDDPSEQNLDEVDALLIANSVWSSVGYPAAWHSVSLPMLTCKPDFWYEALLLTESASVEQWSHYQTFNVVSDHVVARAAFPFLPLGVTSGNIPIYNEAAPIISTPGTLRSGVAKLARVQANIQNPCWVAGRTDRGFRCVGLPLGWNAGEFMISLGFDLLRESLKWVLE